MKYTIEDAKCALDSLDDYARMGVGVDAYGPRNILEGFIEQSAKWRGSSVTLNSLGWRAAEILGVVGEDDESIYDDPRALILKVFEMVEDK